MKTDVTQVIKDLDGNTLPITDPTGRILTAEEGGGPLTLRKVAIEALIQPLRGDEGLDGETKLKHFTLAMLVQEQDQPELSSEHIALIKQRIGKGYGAIVVGRAFKMLEGES